MSIPCPQCRAINPDQAKFCQFCGVMMGATNVQGRTVLHVPVIPPGQPVPRPAIVPDQSKTIVSQYTAALRTGTILPASTPGFSEQLVFAIDVSGSMAGTYDQRYIKLDAAKRATISLVLEKARVNPQDQLALVSFDEQAQVELPLTTMATGKTQMIQVIQALQIRGGTDINEGLKTAGSLLDLANTTTKKRIILLTDGQGGHPLRTAENLKSQGVILECIGIGENSGSVDEALLRKVASNTNGECHYRFITDQRTLIDHVTRLGGNMAQNP
jgi:uncharacterized protein YegL